MIMIKASVRYTINNLKLSQDSDHPNKLPFSGTLLVLDEISDRAPHGSNGHKIYVPREVAQARLSTLVGMPLNYNGDLSDHDSQNVVGVITSAWIEGNGVEVQGYVWKKTFPEAEDVLHGKRLGMSMELADVAVEDKDAPVWRLEDFYFTGATALWPESAAYQRTALAAAAADDHGTEGGSMPNKEKQKTAAPSKALIDAISASMATALQATLTTALAPLATTLTELKAAIATIPASISASAKTETEEEKLTRELNELAAGADEVDEDDDDLDAAGDDDEDEDVAAADDKKAKKDKKKKDDETDEDESAEDEEMDSADDSAQGDITNQNQDARNKGNKTTMTASASTLESMKGAKKTIVTLGSRIQKLETLLASEKKARRSEKKRLDAIENQLEASATHQSRRTLTPDLLGLLEKNGVDINASGAKKLSYAFVDKMFDTCGFPLEPAMRMAFKNQLKAAGYMEQERTM